MLDYVADSKVRNRTASELFYRIRQFMNDEKCSGPPSLLAQLIVRTGIQHEDWRDEVYMQLCKQTTNHPIESAMTSVIYCFH